MRRVGAPWYRREVYLRIRALMEDAENLADAQSIDPILGRRIVRRGKPGPLFADPALRVRTMRYDQWLMAAESNEGEARRVGIEVVRVTIDTDVFTKWCSVRSVARDLAARVAFVDAAMRERTDEGTNPMRALECGRSRASLSLKSAFLFGLDHDAG
jgi:hypothetical protein